MSLFTARMSCRVQTGFHSFHMDDIKVSRQSAGRKGREIFSTRQRRNQVKSNALANLFLFGTCHAACVIVSASHDTRFCQHRSTEQLLSQRTISLLDTRVDFLDDASKMTFTPHMDVHWRKFAEKSPNRKTHTVRERTTGCILNSQKQAIVFALFVPLLQHSHARRSITSPP